MGSLDRTKTIRTLIGHTSPVWKLIFLPDGMILASAAEDIRLWRVEDGRLIAIYKGACP